MSSGEARWTRFSAGRMTGCSTAAMAATGAARPVRSRPKRRRHQHPGSTQPSTGRGGSSRSGRRLDKSSLSICELAPSRLLSITICRIQADADLQAVAPFREQRHRNSPLFGSESALRQRQELPRHRLHGRSPIGCHTCWRLRRPSRAAMATMGSPSQCSCSARICRGVKTADARSVACCRSSRTA